MIPMGRAELYMGRWLRIRGRKRFVTVGGRGEGGDKMQQRM